MITKRPLRKQIRDWTGQPITIGSHIVYSRPDRKRRIVMLESVVIDLFEEYDTQGHPRVVNDGWYPRVRARPMRQSRLGENGWDNPEDISALNSILVVGDEQRCLLCLAAPQHG